MSTSIILTSFVKVGSTYDTVIWESTTTIVSRAIRNRIGHIWVETWIRRKNRPVDLLEAAGLPRVVFHPCKTHMVSDNSALSEGVLVLLRVSKLATSSPLRDSTSCI